MRYLRFFLFYTILCSSLTSVSSAKEYKDFIKATGKEDSGFTQLFKQAEEISKFETALDKEKRIWDNLVKQNNELATTLEDEISKIQNHPIVINYQKTRDELWGKEALLKKEIQKLMNNKPEVIEIKNLMKPLEKARNAAWQRWISFSKEKIDPLKAKQEKLIEEAYKKKYGSATAWWEMTIRQTEAFEAKVKKTKKYQDLANQIEPLKEQADLLDQKRKTIQNEIFPLIEQLEKIKTSIKESKNLPKSLKELKKTIKKLDAKEKEFKKKYREFDLNEAKRLKNKTDEYHSLSTKIFNQYKKMTEQ